MNIVKQAITIGAARRTMREGHDHELALYMVRDLEVTAQAGLTNLCWCMHKYGCVRSEVAHILDTLTDHIQEVYDDGRSR